jgi:hypothetical protein
MAACFSLDALFLLAAAMIELPVRANRPAPDAFVNA